MQTAVIPDPTVFTFISSWGLVPFCFSCSEGSYTSLHIYILERHDWHMMDPVQLYRSLNPNLVRAWRPWRDTARTSGPLDTVIRPANAPHWGSYHLGSSSSDTGVGSTQSDNHGHSSALSYTLTS